MFVECILESLEREKYVSNIYTWKFGVTILSMISAPEQIVFEGQEYGQLDWPSLTGGEGQGTPLEDLELVTTIDSYC